MEAISLWAWLERLVRPVSAQATFAPAPSLRRVIRLRNLVLTVLLMAELVFASGEQTLKVGILPRRSADMTEQMFRPMMDHLGRELKIRVTLDVPPDFQAFWQQVRDGRYDLVHLNQYQYLVSHRQFGYRAVLMNEELGHSEIASVVWVRKDSGIEEALDLKGQKIIFGGGKQAMVSYIMAVDLLRRSGLEEGDYLIQFANNPVNALVSLYYRQGMAAGAGDFLPQLFTLNNTIDLNEIKPLLKSSPVAHLPWAVSREVPSTLAQSIQQVLVNLKDSHQGRKILARAGLTGLVPANDQDYTPHRKIIIRVLGEQF
jgi:phosphonate transport system substrate-binding protein